MSQFHDVIPDPSFGAIESGSKIVEIRLNKGKYSLMMKGDFINIERSLGENKSFESGEIRTMITKIRIYSDFREALLSEGIENCLPFLLKSEINKAVRISSSEYTKEEIKKYGVVAIGILCVPLDD